MQSIRLFRLALAAALSPVLFTASAQFSGPESVEYDPVGDRYFVSNTQINTIKVLEQDGTVANFVTGMPNAPYGLEIMGEVLYAATGNGIRGYDLATGTQVFSRALGATFPNGITTDGEFIYVTDFTGQRIFKVDVANDSHTTLVASTGGTPNGIVFDPVGDRLVVVFWGTNAPIKAYDRTTGASTTLVAGTGLGNIDGVTIDCHGNFITSSWSPARITRWDPTFASPGVNMNVSPLGNPADIDFDAVNQRICIPNSSAGTVTFHEVDCSTGIRTPTSNPLMVVPNPVSDLMHVQPPFTRPAPYILLDARGLLLGGGTLQPNAVLDVSGLAQGSYVLHFTGSGRQVRFVKE
jgi:DNA-binding beta-propeller fold protein YncE